MFHINVIKEHIQEHLMRDIWDLKSALCRLRKNSPKSKLSNLMRSWEYNINCTAHSYIYIVHYILESDKRTIFVYFIERKGTWRDHIDNTTPAIPSGICYPHSIFSSAERQSLFTLSRKLSGLKTMTNTAQSSWATFSTIMLLTIKTLRKFE